MKRTAARLSLVITFMALLYLAPAALVTQEQGRHHAFHVTHDPALLALGGGLVALAYAAYLLAWRVLR